MVRTLYSTWICVAAISTGLPRLIGTDDALQAEQNRPGDSRRQSVANPAKPPALVGKWKSIEAWRTPPVDRESEFDDADGFTAIIKELPNDPESLLLLNPDAEYLIEMFKVRQGKAMKLPDSEPGIIASRHAYLGPIGSCFVFSIEQRDEKLILELQTTPGDNRIRIVFVPDR
jgi:hypothetical protein